MATCVQFTCSVVQHWRAFSNFPQRSRAPPRVDPAWPGTRDFGISPANRRRAGFPTCVPWSSRNGCERACAPQATGFLLFGHHIPLLRNSLCKCLFLQHVTFASKAPKLPGRDATGFPLPSTGRGIEGEGWSYPELPPARASGGGRSRAATPFACGAGTLWRGFARGLRMTLWPSKQPSFPNASLNCTRDRF